MVSSDPNVMALLSVLTCKDSVYATSTWMLPLQQLAASQWQPNKVQQRAGPFWHRPVYIGVKHAVAQ